jgi:hypothetical protein
MISRKQIIIICVTSFIFLTITIVILVNYRKFKKKGRKHFSILDLFGITKEHPWIVGEWDKTCPPCSHENVLRKRTVTCSSENPDNCYEIPQSDDEPLGKPTDQQFCDNPKCSLIFGEWVGGQDFHYQINSPPNTNLFGTNNVIVSGTPSSSLTIVNNAVRLPKGMNGNFMLLIIWHTDSTKTNSFNIDQVNTNVLDVQPVFENKTKTIINNSGNNTSLLYYAYIFSIKNNTEHTMISFSNGNNMITIKDPRYKPELFLLQLNDGPWCQKTSCNIGSLPLMVQFQLVNPTNKTPLGSSNSIIFDSIGITLTSSSITIPNKIYEKNDNTSTYLMLIQWSGNTPTDVVLPTISFKNITPLNFFKNQTASNVSNTLDRQTSKLFYSVIFKLTDVNMSGDITFSEGGNLPSGNSVYGDLLIIQSNYITK